MQLRTESVSTTLTEGESFGRKQVRRQKSQKYLQQYETQEILGRNLLYTLTNE
jgi:hypothetical protein